MIQTFLFVKLDQLGRGSGVLERCLEIAEVLRGGGRRWWRQEAGLHIFWKKASNVITIEPPLAICV